MPAVAKTASAAPIGRGAAQVKVTLDRTPLKIKIPGLAARLHQRDGRPSQAIRQTELRGANPRPPLYVGCEAVSGSWRMTRRQAGDLQSYRFGALVAHGNGLSRAHIG